MEVIGGDFRMVGNDISITMQRHPPTTEEAARLGEPAQLKLKGLG